MARLISALDVPEPATAARLIEALAPLDVIFKVGYEAFYGYGTAVFAALEARNAEVFLDLKLHDIPRTAAAAARTLVRPGVRIMTVHAQGGEAMMRAVVEAAGEAAHEQGIEPPKIFGVTILTSIDELSLPELGISGGMGEAIVRLAALARNAGCAGVVCSPREATDLKAFFGSDFEALCPGIRPSGAVAGDQQRTATPRDAVRAGADYLVVGRPIVEAADPVAAARAVLDEMHSASAA